MVSVPGRRGSSTTGCLVWLVVFGALVYYGIHVGGAYVRFYRLQDAMESQARLAPSLTDDVIRRRLQQQAAEILPEHKPPRFQIKRGGRPPRIVIETQYTDSLDLPLLRRALVFKPRAQAPL
jgi:hypothetical protein